MLLAGLAACSPAAGPSATPGGSQNPSSTPTPNPTATPQLGYQHATGARDVLFRFEQSGFFMPVEFTATYAPSFTLYGDGTVVFKDPNAMPPESTDNVMRSTPFLVAKLDEASIQAFLDQALGQGALAIATGPYMCNCADLPSSVFTINVGGQSKTVSVTGLTPDMHSTDQQLIAAIGAFAEKLDGFADSIGNEQPYVPTAYRGILNEVDQPFGPVVEWPWKGVTPADFKSGDNEFLKTRTMTPDEVEALGIEGIAGGMTGVSVSSDGKVYTFSLRPLLPDETK
jgi:hypothetical protein